MSCNVHAEPAAIVKWYKETMLLEQTNNRYMESYGNRHKLILRNVKENGKQRKSLLHTLSLLLCCDAASLNPFHSDCNSFFAIFYKFLCLFFNL